MTAEKWEFFVPEDIRVDLHVWGYYPAEISINVQVLIIWQRQPSFRIKYTLHIHEHILHNKEST